MPARQGPPPSASTRNPRFARRESPPRFFLVSRDAGFVCRSESDRLDLGELDWWLLMRIFQIRAECLLLGTGLRRIESSIWELTIEKLPENFTGTERYLRLFMEELIVR